MLAFFKVKPAATRQAIKDLIANDHHYCRVCGDLYYCINPKKKYCSSSCKQRFNNAKRQRL